VKSYCLQYKKHQNIDVYRDNTLSIGKAMRKQKTNRRTYIIEHDSVGAEKIQAYIAET